MNILNVILYLCAISLCLPPAYRLSGADKYKKAQTKLWQYTTKARLDPANSVIRALYNLNYGPMSGTPEEIARQYLSINKDLFRLQSGLTDLKTMNVQKSPGGHHVRFIQQFENIPVYQSDVVVSISRNNYVTFVSNNYSPGLVIKNIQRAISGEFALNLVYKYLQVRGRMLSPVKSELMILNTDSIPLLSYRITFSSLEPRGSWEAFVDAQTGELLQIRDIRVFQRNPSAGTAKHNKILTNGSGYVFDPDPLTTAHTFYGTTGFVDNNNSDSPELSSQRILVTLNDITNNTGFYALSGPYVNIYDWDPPFIEPVTAASPDSFRFNRSQSGFEDVNVYYHIDKSQRYIQSLGFDDVQNLPINADPHGDNGADNAYFDPNLNALSFGEGGVDDGEDADVILHEYGHAIQWGIVPGWGGNTGGNEEGGMGEGFGDYWAGTYSRSVDPEFSRNFVFTWDAGFNGTGGTVWSGRPLNFEQKYPAGGLSGVEVHDAGEYWSSVLMLIWDEIGKDAADKIILQSHYYLSTIATMVDNAEAILQADRDFYQGTHVQQLAIIFEQRNFLPPPTITHQPIKDTENLTGPYIVNTLVTPGFSPIAAGGIKVIYTRDSIFTDSVTLSPSGIPNRYSGTMPGTGQPAHFRYYISARTTLGTMTVYPADAPIKYISFYAGRDTIPPTVKYTPIYNPAKLLWPPRVHVTATDNIAVDSVWIEFIRQRDNLNGSFPLLKTDDSTYESVFVLDTSQIVTGDSIFYNVVVRDVANLSNIVRIPVNGFYNFEVSKIKVLLGTQLSNSAKLIYNTLVTKNYTVDSLKLSLVVSADIPKYDLVIMTAGTARTPNFNKRLDIISRVQNGGRVLVEGGNVGAVFVSTDMRFRQIVLHDSTWINDVTASDLIITQPTDPIFTTPNQINSPIGFTTTSTGADRDAVSLIPGDPGVSSLATWTEEPSSSGAIVYTPPGGSHPLTIFYPFAFSSITDTSVAKKLIENSAACFFPHQGATEVTSGIRNAANSFSLDNNYPNPFNPRTIISFQLPTASYVKLNVYNALGQKIADLFEGAKTAGYHKIEFSLENLASGVYFYRLEAAPLQKSSNVFIQTKKMIFIK